MVDKRFLAGLKLFARKKYFEAHDIVEELWLETPKTDTYRDLYKGFIQAAAALYLLKRGPMSGALGLERSSAQYLKRYQPRALGLDVTALIRKLETVFRPFRNLKAVLIVTHGSRSKKSYDEVRLLAQKIKARSRWPIVEYAFLDVSEPTIPQGIEICVQKGAQSITILQNFLNSGNHVLHDIPEIIRAAQKRFPDTKFKLCPPIGQHPKILDLFLGYL